VHGPRKANIIQAQTDRELPMMPPFEPWGALERRKFTTSGQAFGLQAAQQRKDTGVIMRMVMVVSLSAAVMVSAARPSGAQDSTQGAAPGVITGGSSKTLIGGQAAARRGDQTDDGNAIAEGSKNVYIDGKPAATTGSRTGCGGVTVGGSGNVFINGRPAARAGDLTTGCPDK
jgi:uncharacterized Zn-binding protein involved in type VI secretion